MPTQNGTTRRDGGVSTGGRTVKSPLKLLLLQECRDHPRSDHDPGKTQRDLGLSQHPFDATECTARRGGNGCPRLLRCQKEASIKVQLIEAVIVAAT